ncbi:MAG: NosD domain-containing protein [Candidatus Bathyarchaeota archaeon]
MIIKVNTVRARVWTVDDDGTADFTFIQDAIDQAENGDAIHVYNGVYYEHLTISKSIFLFGESRENTIVDGNGTGTVISIVTNNVTIQRLTVQRSNQSSGTSFAGIRVSGQECNVTGNFVTRNKIGIFLTSHNNEVKENVATNNGHGVSIYQSYQNLVESNNFSDNTVGISLAYSFNNIVRRNRVENSSTGGHGITLSSNSYNNTIIMNDLTNNYHGMWLSNSHNNSIVENTVANNELLGIELASSSDNRFYHNNFINNPKHVKIDNQTNIWDNSSHGNYWSDYEEKYPNAEEINGSGIWNTPYDINENNKDNYPLIPEFPSLAITLMVMFLLLFTVLIYKNWNLRNNQSTRCK